MMAWQQEGIQSFLKTVMYLLRKYKNPIDFSHFMRVEIQDTSGFQHPVWLHPKGTFTLEAESSLEIAATKFVFTCLHQESTFTSTSCDFGLIENFIAKTYDFNWALK